MESRPTMLLTTSGAANLLGLDPSQVERLAQSHSIPFIQLPAGQMRFDARDLMRWAHGYRRPVIGAPQRNRLSARSKANAGSR